MLGTTSNQNKKKKQNIFITASIQCYLMQLVCNFLFFFFVCNIGLAVSPFIPDSYACRNTWGDNAL